MGKLQRYLEILFDVVVIDQHSHEVNTLRQYHERQVRAYCCHRQMYRVAQQLISVNKS